MKKTTILPLFCYRAITNQPIFKFRSFRLFIFFSIISLGSLSSVWGQETKLYILNRGGNNILSVPLEGANTPLTEEINQGLLATYDFVSYAPSSKLYWTNGISHQILSNDAVAGDIASATAAIVTVPVDLDIDVLHKKIYWVDNVRKKIYRANLDGSSQEAILLDTFPNLSSIAIFPAKDLMFFADIDTSIIWSCTLSGANLKAIVHDKFGTPIRLLIDTIQQKLYWADDRQNRIERINFDGTVREVFYQGNEKEFPFGLYIDQPTAQLYWTDYGTDYIMRSNLDGSVVVPFVTSGLNDPVAIAIVLKTEQLIPNSQDRNSTSKEKPVGLEEEPAVSVYPNPANNILIFSSLVRSQPMSKILIFDKNGKQIYSANVNERIAQINIDIFPEGLYLYGVSVAGQTLYGHFSIIR